MKRESAQPWMDGLAILLAPALLFGRAIQIQALESVFFYTVTVDRLFFSVLTVALLLRRFVGKRAGRPLSRTLLAFLGMMCFWILYGVTAAFLSPYSGLWEGGKECFFLLRGMCVIYCFYEVLSTRRRVERFADAARYVCIALILLSLWEALSGIHLPTSRHASMPTVLADGRTWLSGLYQNNLFVATGVCYNENNFCAMLTVFLPLFFLTRDLRPGRMALYGLSLAGGVFVLLLNDANIAALGLFAALLVYIPLTRGNWLRKLGMAGGIVLLYAKAADWIGRGLLALKRRVFHSVSARELLERAGVALPSKIRASKIPSNASFLSNFQGGVEKAVGSGSGALMSRLRIYQDAWDAFLASRGLGLGPNGFYPFFLTDRGQRTRFGNPHNWWLEVLSQYGILVFAAYVAGILSLYIRMIRACRRNRDEFFAVAVAMCSAFVIACVAPSSYIGEVYQWALPGLCIVLLQLDAEAPAPKTA